jgi:predicted enzyme related to lactoylglutathione lyase
LSKEILFLIRVEMLAFEVSDLDAEVARFHQLGVRFLRGITETPECRFAIVQDPDGSEVILLESK